MLPIRNDRNVTLETLRLSPLMQLNRRQAPGRDRTGLSLRQGMSVDATLIHAPDTTRNNEGNRHQSAGADDGLSTRSG